MLMICLVTLLEIVNTTIQWYSSPARLVVASLAWPANVKGEWWNPNYNSRVGNRDKLLFVRVGGQRIIMEEANDNNIILGHLSF